MSDTKVETEVEMSSVSPDISITKTERYNNHRLLQLLNNPNVTNDIKVCLRAIKNSSRDFCYLDTTYKLGKGAKIEQLGRFYAMKGVGAQNLSRDVRAALYSEYYWDIDMVNAQPTLLLQYCDGRGLKCDLLKKYVENRDSLLQDICNKLNCNRDTAKERVNAVMFGGNAGGLPDFFQLYAEELKNIRQNVWVHNKTKLKHLINNPNFLNRALAYVLQTEENKCLLAMDRALLKLGRSMDVLIFDGGLVAKTEGEDSFSDDILREVEKQTKIETGYDIKLAVKPMTTTISFVDLTDEYSIMKAEFEKTYFRLRNPQCFGWVHNDEVELLKVENLKHLEGNRKMKSGKPFLAMWLDDENMLTYERLVFCPKKDVPEGCFNIFTKFENEPMEGDYSAFTELMNLTCSNEDKTVEYLENLFAHMVQKPYEKSGVCVCIKGEEGVGKDTLLNFVGKIFGRRHFFNTQTPESDIFHNFNTGTEACIMVKFEEADFKTNKANQSKLKGIITSEVATYRKKGYDTVTLDDYRNFFMTTNQFMPFVLDDTDRRFVLINASSERRTQAEWWKDMYAKLNEQVSAFHFHLLHKDISQFNPRRDRVETEAYRDVKSLTAVPYHADFLQKTICELMMNVKEGENPIKTWSGSELTEEIGKFMGEKFKINVKRMGIDMRVYTDHGLDKKKTMYSNKYELNPLVCMEFLKAKGWWCE